MKIPVLALVALLALPAVAPAGPVAELPVETFFQSPTISNLAFSPNGKFILCVVPYERRQNLAVIDLEKGTKNLLTNFRDKQVQSPQWANNDRILFRVDDDGRESFSLYAINRDGSDPSVLASGYARSGTTGQINDRFSSLLRRLRRDPQNILVLARINHNDWNDVARMNLKTGRMTVVAPAPGNVSIYILDRKDEVRFAVVQDPTQIRRVLYRERSGQPWTELASYHMDEPGWAPVAFDGDNRTVYVVSNLGRKTNAIFRYDTATRQLEAEPVVAHDTFDVISSLGAGLRIYYDESQEKVVGFSFEAERPVFHWLDPEMAQVHARLNSSLPDTAHVPAQFSEDGTRIIFNSYSDRDPGVYYLYDRRRKRVEELAVVRPDVDPALMARVQPVSFQARDGLTLHGYLTLPPGGPGKNLPLVIHPHGGPYGPRDEWGYNPEIQFYANRGFAVLQVNFRGSGGFGQEFEAAGWKRWGLEMQDDLTDGVKWAIGQGIADPDRVVISGASYGGYATMAGLVFTPELYRAGINYVGVVNIETRIPKAVAPHLTYWYRTRLGDLGDADDRRRIRETSPVHFADRIRVPLLMAYGKNDPRVPIDQAYDIERALKRAGVPYELIVEGDEGHGFRNEEKRIAFYARIDTFLKKYVLD
jgi:dipeptidyl aminopeptidase/acylaminoacyl peptidase